MRSTPAAHEPIERSVSRPVVIHVIDSVETLEALPGELRERAASQFTAELPHIASSNASSSARNAPGTVRVVRNLTSDGVSISQSLWWNYVS